MIYKKKEDIIEKISYREIGSRIIQFYSLCQPKEKIEYYEKNNISSRNIDIIIQYIKTNLSFYYQYMRDNKIDLTYILKEINEEKKGYDTLIYKRERSLEKYIKFMNEREKEF